MLFDSYQPPPYLHAGFDLLTWLSLWQWPEDWADISSAGSF